MRREVVGEKNEPFQIVGAIHRRQQSAHEKDDARDEH
jgi:hypothetical protein